MGLLFGIENGVILDEDNGSCDLRFDGSDTWFMYEGWTPYYTLDGVYIGAKALMGYYSPRYGFVPTYEDLVA